MSGRGGVPQLEQPTARLPLLLHLLLLVLVDLREIGLLVVQALHPLGVLLPCLMLGLKANLLKERPVQGSVEVRNIS